LGELFVRSLALATPPIERPSAMSAALKRAFRKSPRTPFAACKDKVLFQIKLGCSRRMAAENAGCCHTAIGRAAKRDPEFAAQLKEAETQVDIAALTRIQEATTENKNWRAAAWMLERRHPEEFGRRAPHSFSCEQVMALLAEIFAFTAPIVPQKEAGDFLRSFNRAMGRVEKNAKNAGRWQKLAGVNVARSPDGKPLRSPYEHPLWCDPDRPTTAKEESDEAIAWINSLPKDEKELLGRSYWRESEAKKNTPKLTTKDKLMKLLAKEKEDEAAKTKAAEPLAEPASDKPATASSVETAEPPAAAHEPAVVVAAPAAAEQNCPEAAAQEVGPQETVIQEDAAPEPAQPAIETPASTPQTERVELVPSAVLNPGCDGLLPSIGVRPPCEDYIPPTPAEHQAYLDWCAQMEAIARRNLLLQRMLPRQAPAAAPSGNVAGGASNVHLHEWCEAMRR
jgi:hypothetical protein